MFKKNAFTLAEVLVVMFLIGFLFTLMIPNVVQKQTSTKFIENAQKAQATLQEAFKKVAEDNDGLYPQDWESVRKSSNKSEAIVKELAKKTSVMSFCGRNLQGCFATTEYRTLNSVPTKILEEDMKPHDLKRDSDDYILKKKKTDLSSDYYNDKITYTDAEPEFSTTNFILLEGGSVSLKTNSKYCDGVIPSLDPLERPLCAIIYVDINGQSIPNTLGVDVFGFYLSGNDILPMGFYGDDLSFEDNCLRERPEAPSNNGLACTAWAIKNKNMEYRKCQAGKRLSWTGAKRCEQQTPAKQ